MHDYLWLMDNTFLSQMMSRFHSLSQSGHLYNRDTWMDESHDKFRGDDEPEIIDGKAYIYVSGPLVNNVGWWEWLDNYTRYSAIEKMTKLSEDNSSIDEVIYVFDTPGGLTNGVERAGLTIRNCSKPTTALVKNGAYSAGYWLASQCDQIIADVDSAAVGSVGTVIEFWDPTAMYEAAGIKRHTFVSKGSENKRPDPNTESGQVVFQSIVDKANESFLNAISIGRNVTVDYILENFGNGGMLFARDALSVKMIDSINTDLEISAVDSKNNPEPVIENKEESSMLLSELKSKHPELFEEVKSVALAEEQERVAAWCEFIDVDASAVSTGIKSGKDISRAEIISLSRKEMQLGMVAAEADGSEDEVDPPATPAPSSSNKGKSSEEEADELLASCGFDVK
jgi:ClpP class serine protease